MAGGGKIGRDVAFLQFHLDWLAHKFDLGAEVMPSSSDQVGYYPGRYVSVFGLEAGCVLNCLEPSHT